MGCSTSKLDDIEAVQLCKDRKNFIKQAVEQRTRFASGHIAYIQSMKRVSAALREYIEGDESCEFSFDSFITPPFKTSPALIPILSKSFTPTKIEFDPSPTLKVNYLRSGGNPAISVEERPQSPGMVRVEAYSPMHQYGIDGFFAMQYSPMNSSSFFSYSPNNRPTIPPPSPQTSQWDFFWNPFSSLDNYGYPTRRSLDQTIMDERIPVLEENETKQEDFVGKRNVAHEKTKIDANPSKEEVVVEDIDDDEEDEKDNETEIEHEAKDSQQAHATANFEVSKAQTAGHIESTHREMEVGNHETMEETPGFTVYVNGRPTSMAGVIRDLEAQFTMVCNAADDVSAFLEARRAQYLPTSDELSATKLSTPVALFRSASRSTSSSLLMNTSSAIDEVHDNSTGLSKEPCVFSVNHQSTLDRLYMWERKLYEEVKSGERVRIAYEKKCLQLRNQDVKEDHSLDKIREIISDLHTQITVSMHTIESISGRIQTLRDQELHPQLLELVQGLARMWKVMAECHQTQKRTLDEAKIILAGTPSKSNARKQSSITDPHRLARSASNLETELRNWRASFGSWITSQRSYIHALTGWLLRCMRPEPDASKLSYSPRQSGSTHPLFGLCVQWSRRLDAIHESAVLDGLDIFASGLGSLHVQLLRDDSRRNPVGSNDFSGNMDMVGADHVEGVMTPEKMADVAVKVLCAGMSVALSSLTEFAIDSAEGHDELVKWNHSFCRIET